MAQVPARHPFQFAVRMPPFKVSHFLKKHPLERSASTTFKHPNSNYHLLLARLVFPRYHFLLLGRLLPKHFTAPSHFAGHLLLHRHGLQPQVFVHYWFLLNQNYAGKSSTLVYFLVSFSAGTTRTLFPTELGQGQGFIPSTPFPSTISVQASMGPVACQQNSVTPV